MPAKTEQQGKRGFRVTREHPATVPTEALLETELQLIRLAKEVDDQFLGKHSVDIEFKERRPVAILFAADLHAGSIATNHEKLLELRDYVLNTPDVYLFLAGDEVDGLKAKFVSTIMTRNPLNFQQQLEFFRELFIRPLHKAGKLLGMVTNYTGHNGWPMDNETIDTWRILTEGMDIPKVRQTGHLNVKFPGSEPYHIQVFHKPPGRSQFDPVHGLREKALSQSRPHRQDVYISADSHVTGTSREMFAGSNSNTPTTLLQVGTLKGSDPEHSDLLGIEWSLPRAQPAVPGFVISPKPKGIRHKRIVNAPDFAQMPMYHTSMSLLDKATQLGITDELIDKIHRKLGDRPTKRFLSEESTPDSASYREKPSARQTVLNRRKARKSAANGNGNGGDHMLENKPKSVQYEEAVFNIQTNLPIALLFIANAGKGNRQNDGGNAARTFVREVLLPDPYKFGVFLRNMMDEDTATSYNREQTLGWYIDLLQYSGDQALAVLFDSGMYHKMWLSHIGPWEGGSQPIAPGSRIVWETGLPLLRHLSQLGVYVGNSGKASVNRFHPIVVLDKLQNHSSQWKPPFGPKQMYRLYMNSDTKPETVVGGHMPNAAAMRFHDHSNPINTYPAIIAPGFFTKYARVLGNGNLRRGAKPGQGEIIIPAGSGDPGENTIIPTANLDETLYLQQAVTLWSGLSQLGMVDKVLKRKK